MRQGFTDTALGLFARRDLSQMAQGQSRVYH